MAILYILPDYLGPMLSVRKCMPSYVMLLEIMYLQVATEPTLVILRKKIMLSRLDAVNVFASILQS